MRLNKYLAPYPILSLTDNDYVDSFFKAELEENLEFGRVDLKVRYNLNDKGLLKLISEGNAEYVTHVECSLLGFRTMGHSSDKEVSITIDESNLAGSTDISTFIVAKKDIPQYSNDKFSYIYGKGAAFFIPKDSILAIGSCFKLTTNRSDKSYSKITDIFAIEHDKSEPEESWMSFDEDCIKVHVNKKMINMYNNYKSSDKYTLITIFFLPALIEALTLMKQNNDSCDSFKWYEILKKLLEKNNIMISDLQVEPGPDKNYVGNIAQRIFKAPIEKALAEIGVDNEK